MSKSALTRFAVLWAALSVVAACSQHGGDAPAGAPDASAAATTEADDGARLIADDVAKTLAPAATIADRFLPTPNGFQRGKDGVTSPGFRTAWTERAFHVGARLPASASAPIEAGVGVSELYRLKLEQVDAKPVTLSIDGGRGVYHDAYASTDETFVASPERLEWAYTLRDDKAPTEFKLRITLPKNLASARINNSRALEFLDGEGHALLQMPAPIAVDASGTKRDVALAWDGTFLTVKLNPSGLTYPIVLDPALETAVWQARVALPSGRRSHVTAYDSIRKRVVIAAGFGGASETWEWDGAVWSLRSTTGPSGQTYAMTFDSARGFSVLVGGSAIWEWDGVAWYQRCTTAPCTSTRPSNRTYVGLAFDVARGKTVLYGGWDPTALTALSDTWTWDGTAWANTGATGPAARLEHRMAYDGVNNRVVMFGGHTTVAGGTYFNDLYAWNGTAWSPLSPSGTKPAARKAFVFDYLASTARFVVHGGDNGGGTPFNDTHEYDPATNAWSAKGTGPARTDVTGAYDSVAKGIVVFGGNFSGSTFGDTWQYSAAGWTLLNSTRYLAAAAYDSYRNRITTFGGNAGGRSNEVLEYNGFAWTPLCDTGACAASRPSPRWDSEMVYDSARRKFVLFGGTPVSGVVRETWEFDGSLWTQRCTAAPCNTTMPSLRSGMAMAYDAARAKTVLFGGSAGSQETWEWDGATGLWAQVCTAAPCSSTLPTARADAKMTFDPDRGRIVMFGGHPPGVVTSALGDTWEYTGTAWIQVATTGPSGRYNVGIAYDSVRKKTVLFGGELNLAPYADTWEWDGATWTRTSTSGPPARTRMVFEYDAGRRRVVAFGGYGATEFGDTWEYYTRGGACSVGGDCATGFCVDGVCCEQVSCSTCQACNLTGTIGQCTAVVSADDTDTCPAATSSCDASGVCKKKQGQTCGGNLQCASGSCANGYCCNEECTGGCNVCDVTPGTCTLRAKGATGVGCGAYFCDGVNGLCPTSCAVDTDCASGYFCASGGVCQATRAAGKPCNTDSGGDCNVAGCRECGGALVCKDGYCCTSACTGSCQTCAKTPGTCTSVVNADDPDTCTGATSCSSAGACKRNLGQSCSLGTDCASGFCVDGYCCNTACSGGCDECSSSPGTCKIVAQGSGGTSPACGAYVCNGSLASCPTNCGRDDDCATGYYCSAAGTCLARKAQGSTCNIASGADCRTAGCRACSSGNCIDGYCCDSLCSGSCNACNGAALGWSSAVNGTCAIAPVAYAGSPACGAYACDGASASCATACTSDAQCGSGSYCNAAGACVAQKTQGMGCNLASDCKVSGSCRACSTGNCVDGYCCNTACGGQCQACDVTGAVGSCVTVTGAVHGSRPACSGTGACAATCNGTDATACRYAGSSVACGTTSCASGVQTNAGTCNGGGACNQTTTPCGSYICGASTCKTSCTGDADCANTTLYCSGSACVSKKANGDSCSGNNACASGNCVSGICCDTACTTSGYSCSIAGSVGKCAKVNGQACATGAECGTGLCVDSVCCNSSCGGQCQACNVSGSVGTCSNVIGAPIGGRPACGGTGAGTTCGSRCDGTSATACAYPASTTSCGAASCTSGVETTAGTCNGAGACASSTKPCGAYLCGSTSCKSTCAGDTDCASGFYCKLGACTAKEIVGAACTTASACASGNCVDGVCCNTSSCTTGLKCNLPGSLGTCSKPNGAACTASTQCASSFCVDGVCCDTGCSSQCAACDVTGKVGTCSAVTGAPRGGRSACAGAGAGTECGPICDGSDITACHYPNEAKSCGANSCTTTGGTFIEKHTSVCNGAGACSDVPKTCGGFICDTTACKSTCTANTDCTTGYYCKSGACIPIEGLGTSCTTASTCTSGFCTDGVCCAVGSCGAGKSCSAGLGTLKGICVSLNGTPCSANAECASNSCVDGVCCDSACTGSCEACNKVGSVGKCVPIVGDPLTGHPACKGTSTDVDCAQRCDGTDGANCKYPGTTASCGKPSCGGGIETQVSTCDGAGTCKAATKTCAPYLCGTTACLSGCTKNADCATGNYCKSGSCVKVEGLGKVCTAAAECESGFCADGVCCSAGSCGEGSSCADASSTTPGACLKKKGVACTKADECATGRCVDGYCCDLACNGQCEACDVSGSEGTCTPVVGAPHKERTACDTLDAKDCAKAQCDGKARDKCDGFVNGGTTSCGVASCTSDKRYQKTGACDGAGKCAMPDPVPCTPYACDATAPSGCKTACATDDECATDYKCEAGACIQGAKCSDDRSQSIDKAGVAKDCKPYRCGSDGKCATACATSDDCASGTTCDPNAKACVIYTVDDSGGDGGCGCSTPGRGRDYGYTMLALVALVALRRRRAA